jgi:uncharacterized protein YuzE
MKNLKFNYDSKFDILYISVVPNEPSVGIEEVDGIVIRRSMKTNEFVGITIFDFKARIDNIDFEYLNTYIDTAFLETLKLN